MAETIIAWTDFTFNAWMGCSKVSEGCRNCYAERLTRDRMGLRIWGPRAARVITKSPWAKLRREAQASAFGVPGVRGPEFGRLVFVGSLMDWAEDRDEVVDARARMWSAIRASPSLTFQMLTKRPENIERFLPGDWGGGYPNVWLGTSVEDMRVSHRVDHLRHVPAVVRFVSYEPALGPLDALDLTGIDWVIYGGESGPGHRGEDKAWARAMRAKCGAAGAAFFHKQSAGYRTELGIELDGVIVREFPIPREVGVVGENSTAVTGAVSYSAR